MMPEDQDRHPSELPAEDGDDREERPVEEELLDQDEDLLDIDDEEPEDDEAVLKRTEPGEAGGPRHVQLTIRRKLAGHRLDKYLHGRFRKVSRTTIQRLIKLGEITVNGKPTKASYEPEGGDIIDLTFPPPEPYEVVPENIPLNIIYEDDFVLVVNKEVGMIVHPASRTQRGTVANALAFYSNSLSKTDDPFRPGIVHRLDKNTSGLMIVAKTDEAHWRLALQFEKRTTQKTYTAVVHGNPEFDEEVINVPIGRHPTVYDRYIATGFAERLGGKFQKKLSKEAVTKYKVTERFSGFSLVELFPKTGRTHQLRIHMSHIRHPIVGDPFYGGRHLSIRDVTGRPEDPTEPHFIRQMLHAHRLVVQHPIYETPLELEAPPPADMLELIDLLRTHAKLPPAPRIPTQRRR
jgi:23S rRNA pseudouridine1911/1915/1917 synthase